MLLHRGRGHLLHASAERLGRGVKQVAVFSNNERSKPQRFQKACVNSEDEKQLPLDSQLGPEI